MPEVERRRRLLARTVTYGLCGVMLVVGAGQVELWPLTAFRLFSGVRTPESVSWQVAVVDARGVERTITLPSADELGLPHHVLPALVDAPPAEQQATVWAYVEAAGEGAGSVAARVYAVTTRTPAEPDVARAEVGRSLAYEVGRP